MHIQLRKVKRYLKLLEENIISNYTDINDILTLPCGYKKDNTLPKKEDMKPFVPGSEWGQGWDSHAWFAFDVEIPENMRDLPVRLYIKTDRLGWDASNPQFICYVDGVMRQGIDTNHTYINLDGKQKFEVFLYAYTGAKIENARLFVQLANVDTETEGLWYDIKVPLETISYMKDYTREYAEILAHLHRAVSMLDLYEVGSAEFAESVKRAREYMRREFYEGYCKKQDSTTVCIGHTHIDCAWKWTLLQTKEKVQRSFSTVIELMDRYPEYKFMSSQPLLYKNLKEEAPEVYEKVKQRVREGRWECEGAMWVEADCNLSSGESLVRQIVYGKRFFREEFGVESRVLWLPDVFGYSAAMPQILKKCGVDWFVTSKISWNDTNTIPFDTFRWKGIDGTNINTFFLTGQRMPKGGGEPGRGTTYVGHITADMVAGTYQRYQNKNLNNEAILTFGFGDGGGGPTEEDLETYRRSKHGIPGSSNAKMDFAGDFLSRLEEKIKDSPYLPEWRGELYLEFHRGTYTSISKNKRNNRKSEFLYLDAELVSTQNKFLANGNFPKQALRDGWEMILTNQFHDIIPGSSIKEVYDQSDIDYAWVKKVGETARDSAASNIASRLSTDKGYVVFNPHSFECDGLVKVDGVSAIVKAVPSKGYTLTNNFIRTNSVKFEGRTVETNRYTVKFNHDWLISSIYDKGNDREVIKAGALANAIEIYPDYPDTYDAWEWLEYSRDTHKVLTDVQGVDIVEDGARRGIKIVRKFQSSTITQTIFFTDDGASIDFETVADWHERHLMVKAAFPVDINSDKATYDIQFGTTERPTHSNTSWDRAKFEVCAHKFADLSDGGYGVAVINDCKYGHDIHGDVMRLSLFKCATDPNPEADQGIIEFTYSICPHTGAFAQSDIQRLSYYLNYPMYAIKATGTESALPESFSAVSIDCDNVICETVKQAEDTDATVIRLYESKNRKQKAKLKVGFPAKKCFICDMLERELYELPIENGEVKLSLAGFEVITLKFE